MEKAKRKSLIKYSVIFGSIGCMGIAGGIILKTVTSAPEVDYSSVNVNSYQPDIKKIMKKYESYKGNAPEDFFTSSELINIGQEKFRTCENCYILGKGLGVTALSQEIRNQLIKNGNKYFEESISKSVGSLLGISVSLANRVYQEEQEVKKYYGDEKTVTFDSASYLPDYDSFNLPDYRNSMGKTLDEMFIYVISDKTIKKDKISKKDNGNILVNVQLDEKVSVCNYVKQMKTISNLDKYPAFSLVDMTYELNSKLELVQMNVHEVYKATMVVSTEIDQNIEYRYFPNSIINIPNLEEKLDYSIFE